MVDPEPGGYRPRRAFLEPDPSDDESVTSAVDDSQRTLANSAGNGSSARRAGSRAPSEPAESSDFDAARETRQSDRQPDTQSPQIGTPDSLTSAPSSSNDDIGSDRAASPRSIPTPDSPTGTPSTRNEGIGSDWAASRRSIFADLDDDDAAPPLYRDSSPESARSEETTSHPTGARPSDADEAQVDTGRQTWVRPALANAPRRFRPSDPEATTILPRTSTGSVSSRGWQDSIDDFSDIDEGRFHLGRRTKLALLIAGVAAVVVAGLAIGRAVLVGDTPTTSPSTGSSPTSAPSGVPPAELLNEDAMLSAKDAKRVSSNRTWQVALTQRGMTAESQKAACLGEPAEGQPMSALTMLRLLSANGKEPPGILHEADAFTTPDEAGQAFAVAAKTLGGCAELGGYIQSGWSVTGLGDQAVGLVVVVERDGKTKYHSIVLNRTGSVTNVMDVARNGDSVEIAKVANALAAPTAVQCRNSGGACPKNVSVKPAPPPIGGDVLGFLAAGDLPPVAQAPSLWVGDIPDVPRAGFAGSQCENLDWAKSPASARVSRTYLLDEGPDPAFGLDQIVLTMKNDEAARKFVGNLRKTVEKCPKRKLTASVPSPKSVSGPGAGGKKVEGWAVTVRQKVSDGSLKYRLGAVAAGQKVVYTFLSPKGKLDLSDDEWRMVAVRAGQRATQVN